MKNRYNFFVLEVVKAWTDPSNIPFDTAHARTAIRPGLRQIGAGL